MFVPVAWDQEGGLLSHLLLGSSHAPYNNILVNAARLSNSGPMKLYCLVISQPSYFV